MKRWSTKYGKNSKNNKFHKILHLERGKVKKGFRKSTNFAKIAKVTRSFPAMWKDEVTNMTKIEKRKGQEGLRDVRKFRKNRKSNKNFSCYVKRLSNKYGKNSKNNKFNEILHLEREKGKESLEIWQNATNCARVTRIGKNCWRARKGPRTPAHHCFSLILMVISTGIRSCPVIL